MKTTRLGAESPHTLRLTPRECERLQGFPDDWTAGFSDSVRYRMLGNAVAVPVAEWISKRLRQRIGNAVPKNLAKAIVKAALTQLP